MLLRIGEQLLLHPSGLKVMATDRSSNSALEQIADVLRAPAGGRRPTRMRRESRGRAFRLLACSLSLTMVPIGCTGDAVEEGSSTPLASSAQSSPRMSFLESQIWGHERDAYGSVVVVAPQGIQAIEVRLIDRNSGAVTVQRVAEVRRSTCHLTEVERASVLYRAKGSVVIDSGAITNDNDGPKIDARYRVEVVFKDGSGGTQTAIARFAGLCSVFTE